MSSRLSLVISWAWIREPGRPASERRGRSSPPRRSPCTRGCSRRSPPPYQSGECGSQGACLGCRRLPSCSGLRRPHSYFGPLIMGSLGRALLTHIITVASRPTRILRLGTLGVAHDPLKIAGSGPHENSQSCVRRSAPPEPASDSLPVVLCYLTPKRPTTRLAWGRAPYSLCRSTSPFCAHHRLRSMMLPGRGMESEPSVLQDVRYTA
jgi:hypothetical protein